MNAVGTAVQLLLPIFPLHVSAIYSYILFSCVYISTFWQWHLCIDRITQCRTSMMWNHHSYTGWHKKTGTFKKNPTKIEEIKKNYW